MVNGIQFFQKNLVFFPHISLQYYSMHNSHVSLENFGSHSQLRSAGVVLWHFVSDESTCCHDKEQHAMSKSWDSSNLQSISFSHFFRHTTALSNSSRNSGESNFILIQYLKYSTVLSLDGSQLLIYF